MMASRFVTAPRVGLRRLSVVQALDWAFRVEGVSVDFDEINPDAWQVGCDPIYRMMQNGVLGCRVDGGGVSPRADDAEVIASIVARLPIAHGGRGMAVQIARYARAGTTPDPMVGAAPACVPRDGFRLTKHGEFARTEVVGVVETLYRGRKTVHDVVACPVSFRPSAAQIGSARRGWLAWWGALLHLRHDLATCGLATLDLTPAMPPREPWNAIG